jgi:hypothetical protein
MAPRIEVSVSHQVPGEDPLIRDDEALAIGVRNENRHPRRTIMEQSDRYSIMQSLEMSGSYPLSDEAIDGVLKRTSPGNYALGYMDDDEFEVFYLGRSDADVRQRLHEWVGMPSRYKNYASPAMASWGVQRHGQLPVDTPVLAPVGNSDSSYTRFAYSYAPSAEAAFEKECRNYEDFGGSGALDNEAHPVRTSRSSGECVADRS